MLKEILVMTTCNFCFVGFLYFAFVDFICLRKQIPQRVIALIEFDFER